MFKCNRVRSIIILVGGFFLLCILSACSTASGEESENDLSTSLANTIESNILQYTVQAQQLQLTVKAENLAAQQQPPQQSVQTSLPWQPNPEATS